MKGLFSGREVKEDAIGALGSSFNRSYIIELSFEYDGTSFLKCLGGCGGRVAD
jgi:nitroimidazol reductase NimA-like FMN-containing flavoprotein (pyridoxamine 5'-phosphate oxidase superfamily)